VPAVAELVDNGVVRILDVASINKDADGNVTMFEYDVLDDVLASGSPTSTARPGAC
jgi:hypothetical protein